MSPMLSAAYYTHHNTEIFFLVLFAVLALAALIKRQVALHRRQWHPYFRINLPRVRSGLETSPLMYELKLDQWPMPGSYDDIMGQMAEYGRELHDQMLTEWINGEMSTWPMVDAWKLIEPDFQIENV